MARRRKSRSKPAKPSRARAAPLPKSKRRTDAHKAKGPAGKRGRARPSYIGWAPALPPAAARKLERERASPEARAAERAKALERAAGRPVEPERDLAGRSKPMGSAIRDAAVAARLRFKEVKRGRTYRDRSTGRMVKAANVKRAIATARNAAAIRYYAAEKGKTYAEARAELSARWRAVKAERKRLSAEIAGLRKMGLPLDREALKRLRALPGSFEGVVRAEVSPKKGKR